MSRQQRRLFFGIALSERDREGLLRIIHPARQIADDRGYAINWVTPQNLHITLKFLGSTPEDPVDQVYLEAKKALHSTTSFSVIPAALGCFPNSKSARILWIGVQDPKGMLNHLANTLNSELEPLGYKREQRPFHPHITIGRLRKAQKIQALLESASVGPLKEVQVKKVTLFESLTYPTGVVYEVVNEIPLLNS